MEDPRRRVLTVVALAAYLAVATVTVDWRGGGGSAKAEPSACEESGASGFTPRYCLNVPNIQANARDLSFTLFSDADEACAAAKRAYAGTRCGSDAPRPTSPSTQIVCADGGKSALGPTLCVEIPASAGPASTGTGELPASSLSGAATRADLRADPTVASATGGALGRAADRYIADLEKQFGRPFTARPKIYVFGTSTAFRDGIVRLFGYPPEAAAVLAADHGGVYIPGADVIAVNWEKSQQESILRHELSHLMVRQIAGSNGKVPSWLDEGLATLDWETVIGGDVERQRYALRALAELGKLRLDRLTYGGQFSLYEYAFAAEGVRALLREDESVANRLLADVRAGATFSAAFATRTGVQLAQYQTDFAAKYASSVAVPKLFQLPELDKTGNAIFLAYGYTPKSALSIEVVRGSYKMKFSQANDDFGSFAGAFGSTAPPGVYDLTVTGPVRTASLKLRTTPN